MTIGWELSAASFAAGQSYSVGARAVGPCAGGASAPAEAASGSGRWIQRTYLVWEPRFGVLPGFNLEDPGSSSFVTAGVGATIGARWDRAADAAVPGQAAWLLGGWGGGAYVLSGSAHAACNEDLRATLSLALGLRGGEWYMTPKVGLLNVPEICIDLDFKP
jgi:hypothetical protein